MSKTSDRIYVLDRVEEGQFVLISQVDRRVVDSLPQGVKPGDSLLLRDGKWFILPQESAERAERVMKKFNELFRK